MDTLFRNIDRASYHHQAKAIDALRDEVLATLAVTAPGHGPWWHGTTFGFWHHDPGRDPVPGRRQTIRCERCRVAGADLAVFGPASEAREVRTWGLDSPCAS